MYNRGTFLVRSGRIAKGAALLREALGLFEAELPPTHPNIADCRARLAKLHRLNEKSDNRVGIGTREPALFE